MFNFERLEVWHNAIAFADLVYATTRGFSAEERFGLTNQMRRAAVAISSNLAEGISRISKNDFARFVEIAAGSLFEVVSQSFISRNRGLLNEDQFRKQYQAADEQGRMLGGLKSSFFPNSSSSRKPAINHQLSTPHGLH